MSYDQLIIFDLDDTLVDTSDVYWRARTLFVKELARTGWNPDEITELFEEIDAGNIKSFGFAPDRYGRSMRATYNHFLQQHNIPADPATLRTIESCGRVILESLPELIRDADILLKWASERCELALVTRGEPVLQTRKIEHTDLLHYFRVVKVVADKDADTFIQVIRDMGSTSEKTWVIGDSIRTDINPGVMAGAKCILYRYKHHSYLWRQEHGQAAVGPFYIAHSLREVINILQSPTSFRMVREA
jgi:putative hydrolase of the HAD superfamily